MTGASISQFLLEKGRVVQPPAGIHSLQLLACAYDCVQASAITLFSNSSSKGVTMACAVLWASTLEFTTTNFCLHPLPLSLRLQSKRMTFEISNLQCSPSLHWGQRKNCLSSLRCLLQFCILEISNKQSKEGMMYF